MLEGTVTAILVCELKLGPAFDELRLVLKIWTVLLILFGR